MRKKILWVLLGLFIISVLSMVLATLRINRSTDNQVFNDVSQVPVNKVGLLLGTSKLLRSGKPNQYFGNRILAANQLFSAGKIQYIVISGDNGRQGYNEPQEMKAELVKLGVPAEKIYLDYAGFRTYDSVYRLRDIFGQGSFTVISQEFHNRRAIYIAQALGLQAVGFNANDVDAYNGFKTQGREKFARLKVFIDLLMNKKPKFLGEKIKIAEE
jgi:SanA protein